MAQNRLKQTRCFKGSEGHLGSSRSTSRTSKRRKNGLEEDENQKGEGEHFNTRMVDVTRMCIVYYYHKRKRHERNNKITNQSKKVDRRYMHA